MNNPICRFAIAVVCLALWSSPAGAQLKRDGVGVAVAGTQGRLVIAHVQAGSPAASAGLRVGDVIATVGSRRYTTWSWTPALAEKLMNRMRGGRYGRVGVVRAGHSGVVDIELKAGKVDATSIQITPRMQEQGVRGMHFVGVGLRLRLQGSSYIIDAVFPGSSAAKAGIKPGYILHSIDHTKPRSLAQAYDYLRAHARGGHAKVGDKVFMKVKTSPSASPIKVELVRHVTSDPVATPPCASLFAPPTNGLARICKHRRPEACVARVARARKQLAKAKACAATLRWPQNTKRLATLARQVDKTLASYDKHLKASTSDYLVGAECTRRNSFRGRHLSMSPRRESWSAMILKLACSATSPTLRHASYYRSSRASTTLRLLHADAPVRRFDHLRAGVMLAFFRRSAFFVEPIEKGTCQGRARGCTETQGRAYVALGVLHRYATRLDPTALAAAVAKQSVSAAAQKMFVRVAKQGRAKVLALVARLHPVDRRILVDIPAKEWAKDDAYVASNKAVYAELDKLAKAAASGETLAALEKVRASYLSKRKYKARAFDEPAFAYATELIRDKARQHGDLARAIRDSYLRSSMRVRFAPTRWSFLQKQALEGSDTRRGNPGAIGSQKPTGAHVVAYQSRDFWSVYYRGKRRDLGIKRTLFATASAKIGRVRKRRGRAIIHFDTSYMEDIEKCRETRRVDRVTRSGRVIYRENCRVVGRRRVKGHKIDPVSVPKAEVARLRRGVFVEVVFDPKTRRGYLIRASKGKKTLRRGRFRVR